MWYSHKYQIRGDSFFFSQKYYVIRVDCIPTFQFRKVNPDPSASLSTALSDSVMGCYFPVGKSFPFYFLRKFQVCPFQVRTLDQTHFSPLAPSIASEVDSLFSHFVPYNLSCCKVTTFKVTWHHVSFLQWPSMLLVHSYTFSLWPWKPCIRWPLGSFPPSLKPLPFLLIKLQAHWLTWALLRTQQRPSHLRVSVNAIPCPRKFIFPKHQLHVLLEKSGSSQPFNLGINVPFTEWLLWAPWQK